MYLLGGFDGFRRNDMYRIPLPEEISKEEQSRRKRKQLRDQGGGAAPDDEDVEAGYENTEAGRLRAQILELQSRLDREQERHICKICYDREIDTIVIPCNHRVVCWRCGAGVKTCPWGKCRKPCEQILQTYGG